MNKTTAEFPKLLLANYHRDSNTAMAALLWQRRALYRAGARTLGEAIDLSGSDLRRAGFSEAMLCRLIARRTGGVTCANRESVSVLFPETAM